LRKHGWTSYLMEVLFMSIKTKVDRNVARAKKRKRPANLTVPEYERTRECFKVDGETICIYTGRPIRGVETLEHFYALGDNWHGPEGGTTAWNCFPAGKEVNEAKGCEDPWDFICREFPRLDWRPRLRVLC